MTKDTRRRSTRETSSRCPSGRRDPRPAAGWRFQQGVTYTSGWERPSPAHPKPNRNQPFHALAGHRINVSVDESFRAERLIRTDKALPPTTI